MISAPETIRIVILYWLRLAMLLLCKVTMVTGCHQTAYAQDIFMNGVDISSLGLLESDGAVYRRADGTAGDAIRILESNGIDWYRLRLFVNPNGSGQVVNDIDYTLALAQRVKSGGGKFLLDLHYSDTWADPGQQAKPASWAQLNAVELTARVEDYTRGVLNRFGQEGLTPDAVQIGNEVSNGMLWDSGRLYHTADSKGELDRFADLLRAGIRGVDLADHGDLKPQKWIHIADGSRWASNDYLLNELEGRGVEFDTIAYSYYPRFHGTLDQLRENIERTAQVYSKPVVLAEIGFAYSGIQFEPQSNQFEHSVSREGQAAFTADVIKALADVPDGLGRGAFWWHGDAVPTASGYAWEGGRLGLFDGQGRVLPAATALGMNLEQASVKVFTEGTVHHGTPSNAYGQSLIVGHDPRGDSDIDPDREVQLRQIKFSAGGQGGGTALTRLAILYGSEVAFSEEVGGRLRLNEDAVNLLGLSENTVNTENLDLGEAMIFSFDQVTLSVGDLISAVYVLESSSGGLYLQQVSQAFIAFDEVLPGQFSPVANYGGDGNVTTAALFGDFNEDQSLDAAQNGYDLSFRATFIQDSTPVVPEPSCGGILIGLFAPLVIWLRKVLPAISR